jgi:hypothetical protein
VLALGAANSPAYAQTPGTGGPISLGELFTALDSVELKPGAESQFRDAARRALAAWDALAPGQCPKPRFKITVVKGDDLFQVALAQARRDVLLGLLSFADKQKFLYVHDIEGTASDVVIDASVADTAPPTIVAAPMSGTKVRVGQRLTIAATATEPSTGWQAGVKHIHIEDVARHTNLAYWDNPAAEPQPCGNAGLSHTEQGSYLVPNEPIARLRIKARDYHNPQQELLVEYPTGSWRGTIRATVKGNAYNDTAVVNYTVAEGPERKLTGRGHVTVQSGPNHAGDCTYTRTITPSQFEVEITGSREGDNLELKVSREGSSTWVFTAQCRGCGSGTGPPANHPFNPLASILSDPRIRIWARDGERASLPPRATGEMTWTGAITIEHVPY